MRRRKLEKMRWRRSLTRVWRKRKTLLLLLPMETRWLARSTSMPKATANAAARASCWLCTTKNDSNCLNNSNNNNNNSSSSNNSNSNNNNLIISPAANTAIVATIIITATVTATIVTDRRRPHLCDRPPTATHAQSPA